MEAHSHIAIWFHCWNKKHGGLGMTFIEALNKLNDYFWKQELMQTGAEGEDCFLKTPFIREF